MSENKATVAIVTDSVSFVLIKRAEFEGDPWSGNYALPGGHIKSGESPEDAVLRETFEEIGLNFSPENIAFRLEVAHPFSRPEMDVIPFVVRTNSFAGMRNGEEVKEIRVARFDSGIRTTNIENKRPALDFSGWIVWGLTFRILNSYFNSQFRRT
jgi:ADP-ribose pyrophosphatase YjhB (NUDIX family)